MTRALILAVLIGCKSTPRPVAEVETLATAPASWELLTAPWEGPYGGVPPLDRVKTEMFVPAVRAGMAEHMAEIEAIATNTAPPSVENVLEAFERSGGMLHRASTALDVWTSTMSSPDVREAQSILSPELSAHWSKIWQNPALYARVKAFSELPDLTPQQQRWAESTLRVFVRAGVDLESEKRAEVAKISGSLATLYDRFSNNELADEEGFSTKLGPDDIDGLPASWLDGAKDPEAAQTWWVHNTRSSVAPFLTYSTNRAIREKVWRTFYNRGDNGDEHDNNAIIAEIVKLRTAKAKLLGYDTFADFMLADKMAKNPATAIKLLERVFTPAVKKFREEVKAMQALADEEQAGITIEAWDVKYYGERIRQRDFDLDAKEVTAYLQLEKLREAMFWAAGELYGFQFEQVDDVPVQHPDVRVWKVLTADGTLRGLWYFDPYAREGKQSGAWMNAYQVSQTLDPKIAIVTNQSNFVKPSGDAPVTISWDDAETLFHEFGHALHGLSAEVKYPSQSGTNVVRDFVEFPSQLNEAWLATPEVLQRFALHVETGEPMPEELIKRLEAASNATSGYANTELLASALVDLKIHQSDGNIDADAFEKQALKELDLPNQIVMRHRLPHFGHIFAGEGYAAGYYNYVWADVLTEDAAEAFAETGSFYDKTVAKRYYDEILSVGDTVDAADAFRAFRGRDADVGALLRARGFPDK